MKKQQKNLVKKQQKKLEKKQLEKQLEKLRVKQQNKLVKEARKQPQPLGLGFEFPYQEIFLP